MTSQSNVEVVTLAEFLAAATREIQALRDAWPALEAGDAGAWARTRNVAHNLAARALAEGLGVLQACARELEQLAAERQRGAPLDAFFLQCAGSAIETLALEVDALRRA